MEQWSARMTPKGQLKITVPIYYGVRKKYMLGLNWLQDAHYRARNLVKQQFTDNIGKVLPKDCYLKSPIETHYKVYFKNKKSDAGNIVAVTEKFLMDALQVHNVIEEDNVQHYRKSAWVVMEQDTENPRVEVTVKCMKLN